MVVFSGGMSYDRTGRTPSITVMAGKSTFVLEMEHNVVDFVSLCDTPWVNDFQDPYAIVVLLQNDLVVIDLTTQGYPCFENPYPMDLHESPVTACQYYANCPMDIIPALYSTGKNQKKTGFSEKPWPIKGGSWGASGTSYPEIIITGHADGSLKFWDASSVTLQFLYKLKTAKVFEKPKRPSEDKDDDPFAIQNIFLCLESRIMCVAGPTHCILFKFSKQETSIETVALEFSIVYEVYDELESPEFDFSKPSLTVMSSMGSYSSNTSDNAKGETMTSVKAKSGSRRWGPGFLPDMVCILCWVDGEPPGNITVMSLNSSYGLLAFGNESGLAIVDYMQKTCLLNLGTPDLYGSMDPYQRAPRSPRSKKSPADGLGPTFEDFKSPTIDQSSDQVSSGRNLQPLASEDTHSPRAMLTPFMPKAHKPVLKTSSLTLAPTTAGPAGSEMRHDIVGKSASLGLQSSTVLMKNTNSISQERKIPPPRPPPPKINLKNVVSENMPESLHPFVEDHFIAESPVQAVENKPEMPVAPPRPKQKNKQQKTLVHQPALDVPNLSPNADVKSHNSIVSQVSSASVTALAPVISLPRSVSEVTEISKAGTTTSQPTCKNPELLSPSATLKPRSTSTGNIPSAQRRHSGTLYSVEPSDMLRMKELASKTMSDPKHHSRESDKVDLRKSSSDSNIPTTDISASALGGRCSNQPWLNKKAQKRLPQKMKTDLDDMSVDPRVVPSFERNDSDEVEKCCQGNSDCDFIEKQDTEQNSSVPHDQEEFTDNFESKEKGKEYVHKSAGHNKNFFSRVSLKIKALGGRKSSNEDEDSGPLSGHWVSQKSQDRHAKVKIEVMDLTDDGARKHNMQKMYLSDVLQSRKTVDTETSPCLWVGTSLGSVIVIVLVLQPDQRLSQPVIVSPSGSLYRLKGAIVCMSFLDFKGSLIPSLCEQWRDTRDNKDISERASKASSRQMSVSNSKPKISPTSSTEINNDRQFAIICSEKQARAISLPSQTCAFKVKVTESSFVVRAEVVGMRDSVCLMCYVANGHILAFSLPSLKPLFDADFLPLTDYRVARTFCFSNTGHAMFLCSHTEIQKITYSAEISENLNEMLGELFLPKETPEAPKQGFLKSLFGGGVSTLDREELFGEASGKASKGLAKHIPGSGNLQIVREQANASGNEFTRTRLLLSERGEKLGEVEDRSAQMMNSAEQFASAAHSIRQKYKDKKWYQF
ncbi:syntaxin-binding protein 5 [Plakobranchus ocellatus]|uniref:Syntaxin-binding protein 5 n=1 Tax=Plakobranchus ocellatus TaxID=259542 RepID=A0AAV3ZED0_9GAST|nr:syntaxin-binding protein 5 [Plakobranchus ocellatus]